MPPLLLGRQWATDRFSESIDDGSGAPDLLTLVTGARGIGKTVMLTELGDVALGAGDGSSSMRRRRGALWSVLPPRPINAGWS